MKNIFSYIRQCFTLYATIMLRQLTTIMAIFFSLSSCRGQNMKPGRSALSVELGKTGIIYNLGFDHKFAGKNVGFRFGAGSNFARYLNLVTVGGGGYYLIGRQNHFLELGADLQYLVVEEISDDQKGFSFVYPDYSVKTFYPTANIGYRSYGKRTLFKLAFSPGLIDGEFVPGGFISLGMTF